MAVRSLARRHLVPSLRLQSELLSAKLHYSTSLASTASSSLEDSETSVEGQFSVDSDQSSSSKPTIAASLPLDEPPNGDATWSFFTPSPWKVETKSKKAKHPLVENLIHEVYGIHRQAAANRVWRAYTAVRDNTTASVPGKGPVPLLTQLEPIHHQLVLRAIDPAVSQCRKMNRLRSKRRALENAHSAQGSGLPADAIRRQIIGTEQLKSRSYRVFNEHFGVRDYMQKVNVVFREMRRHTLDAAAASRGKEVEILPSVSDYNHVLSKLAPGGHLSEMAALWNELNGVTAKAAGTERRKSTLVPNRQTYKDLMFGLSKHSADQIERVQKGEASRTAQISGKRRNLGVTARTVASGLTKKGWILAPAARAAAILAALRTLALIKDMRDHGVKPNKITMDLAARMLRLAGHRQGLDLLLKEAYGIDLSAPDSDVASGSSRNLRPTVHTLNTILMTLGEQATVPEMISAFETLSRPLPVSHSQQLQADDGGLFSADWSDIVRSVRRTNDADATNVTDPQAKAIPYSHPHQISPNTKTFEILIRHCTTEIDPLRTPVALVSAEKARSMGVMAQESTENAIAEIQEGGSRADEQNKRVKGEYLLFGKYLIQEALDKTQENISNMAEQLGITILSEEASQTEVKSEAEVEEGADDAVEALSEMELEAQFKVTDDLETTTQANKEMVDESPASAHPAISAVPERALEADFLPCLDPPAFSITAEMVMPFLAMVAQKQRVRHGEIRWTGSILSQALTAKLTALRVVDVACQVWDARLKAFKDASGDHKVLPLALGEEKPTEVILFLSQLRHQYTRIEKDALALERLLYEKFHDKVRLLAVRRKLQQKRRKRAFRQARQQAEQLKLKEEQALEAKKAAVAKANRIKAAEEQQQAAVDEDQDLEKEKAPTV